MDYIEVLYRCEISSSWQPRLSKKIPMVFRNHTEQLRNKETSYLQSQVGPQVGPQNQIICENIKKYTEKNIESW